MQKILTPMTTSLLVNEITSAGYIEHAENFPLVSEVGDQFLFIQYDQVDGNYFVSSWFIKNRDYRFVPYHICETFEEAILAFNNFFRDTIEKI